MVTVNRPLLETAATLLASMVLLKRVSFDDADNRTDCRAEHQNDDNQHDKQVSSFFDHIRFLLYSLACGDAIKRNVPTIALYIFNVSH